MPTSVSVFLLLCLVPLFQALLTGHWLLQFSYGKDYNGTYCANFWAKIKVANEHKVALLVARYCPLPLVETIRKKRGRSELDGFTSVSISAELRLKSLLLLRSPCDWSFTNRPTCLRYHLVGPITRFQPPRTYAPLYYVRIREWAPSEQLPGQIRAMAGGEYADPKARPATRECGKRWQQLEYTEHQRPSSPRCYFRRRKLPRTT